MAGKGKGSEVGTLAIEACLVSGSTAEFLEALRTVLAVRVLDPERKDTAALARVLMAVEQQQTAATPAAVGPLDQLKARREQRGDGAAATG